MSSICLMPHLVLPVEYYYYTYSLVFVNLLANLCWPENYLIKIGMEVMDILQRGCRSLIFHVISEFWKCEDFNPGKWVLDVFQIKMLSIISVSFRDLIQKFNWIENHRVFVICFLIYMLNRKYYRYTMVTNLILYVVHCRHFFQIVS